MSDEFVLRSSWFTAWSEARQAVRGKEDWLRLAFWQTLREERNWLHAWRGLCLIADEVDLERLAEDARATNPFALRILVGSFLLPTTERQWDLLRMGAKTEREAVRALRLVDSERGDLVLAEALGVNFQYEDEIRRALEYRRNWRRPSRDTNLERLVSDFGQQYRPELKQEVKWLHRSSDQRKALVSFLLWSEELEFDLEVTYREDLGEWSARSVQFAVHGFRVPGVSPPTPKPRIEFGEPPKILP